MNAGLVKDTLSIQHTYFISFMNSLIEKLQSLMVILPQKSSQSINAELRNFVIIMEVNDDG